MASATRAARIIVRRFFGGAAGLATFFALGACAGTADNGANPSSGGVSSASGASSGANSGANSGVSSGANSAAGSGVNPGAGSSANSGASSGANLGAGSGASSGANSGSSAGSAEAGRSPDAVLDSGIAPTSDGGGGLFADCSLAGGCIADCSPPANDPIATGNSSFDLYDGCILAAMRVAGMTEAWEGQLLKCQADNESGITPVITTNDGNCGGQNCGSWAISAGSVSGDSPPGPCGSSSVDPFTGQVDYSHSYGLFQETPACEGTFLQKTLPSGYTCTPTTKADNIPFDTGVTFYCESATSLGVSTPTGTNKGYINAVQNTSDPLYATSIFNPAYQIYVYMDYTWGINFQGANARANGCTQVQQWYLSLAYWLTGSATTSCTLTGAGQQYAQSAVRNYAALYKKTWPYPGP